LPAERKSAVEHIAAVLLIVGCSNSLEQCRELPAPVTVFETLAQCAVERPRAVGKFGRAHPRIFSRCLMVDPALEGDYNEIQWSVRADGTFEASIGGAGTMIAANGSRS
jgi:hypothetical protein